MNSIHDNITYNTLLYGTCKSHENVVIKEADLAHSPLLLQLGHGLLLHTQHHHILALHTHLVMGEHASLILSIIMAEKLFQKLSYNCFDYF